MYPSSYIEGVRQHVAGSIRRTDRRRRREARRHTCEQEVERWM